MALDSAYRALPQSGSNNADQSNVPQGISHLFRQLAYTFVATVVICIVVILAIAALFESFIHGPLTTNRLNSEDLTPPLLVVKPEMKNLHYCGFDPDDPQTIPRIPPLNDSEYELVQVQAFVRHGARFINAPAKCWPGQENVTYDCSLDELGTVGKNPADRTAFIHRLYRMRYMENRNFFKGDCRLGQLTSKGHRQHIVLGKMFHDSYINSLLDPELGPEQIFIRSHDIPRTIMSAQAFASGMFPENSASSSHIPLVDIWTMDSANENEVINPHECPGVEEQRQQARDSPDYLLHEETITADLNEKLSLVTGLPVDQLGTNKFDCFFVSMCQGSPVPAGIDMDLARALEMEARYNLYYLMQFPDRIRGSRLTIGPLLYEILQQWRSFESSARFSLYSGHDSGPIMLLLSAFGVEDGFWAPFAAYISLELYNRQGQQFVRFIYNGDVRKMPFGGDENGLIALATLEEYLAPMIPTLEECPRMRQFIS